MVPKHSPAKSTLPGLATLVLIHAPVGAKRCGTSRVRNGRRSRATHNAFRDRTPLHRVRKDAVHPLGFYCYASARDATTGSWQLPDMPAWSPTNGLDFPCETSDLCINPSFYGGTVHLTQWTDGTYDYGMTSTGVYQAHFAGNGWQPRASDGATIGTVWQGLQVEVVNIKLVPKIAPELTAVGAACVQNRGWTTNLSDGTVARDIQWRGHVQDIGWQP